MKIQDVKTILESLVEQTMAGDWMDSTLRQVILEQFAEYDCKSVEDSSGIWYVMWVSRNCTDSVIAFDSATISYYHTDTVDHSHRGTPHALYCKMDQSYIDIEWNPEPLFEVNNTQAALSVAGDKVRKPSDLMLEHQKSRDKIRQMIMEQICEFNLGQLTNMVNNLSYSADPVALYNALVSARALVTKKEN